MALTASDTSLSYEAKLADLRARLKGRAYCKPIKDLLPTFSENQIRNLANGRGENELFIAAFEIAVRKMETSHDAEVARLVQEAQQVGFAA